MIDIYSKVKKASNEDGCEEKKGNEELGFININKKQSIGQKEIGKRMGEISWTLKERIKDTSAYILANGLNEKVENRRNIKVVKIHD